MSFSYLGHIEYLKDNDKYNFYSLFSDEWNSNELIIEPYQDIFNNNKKFKKDSYNGMKYCIFIYFKELLKLLNNKNLIDDDIKIYLHQKFFNNMNKTNYYNFLSWFSHLLKYYINNYNINESINYKMFRKYCLKNKFLYELNEEEEKEFFRENIRSDKTYNILINELNKNINDEEIKIKIKTMIKYLYYNKIIVFGAGLFGLS
jgi:hypothetical protein